MYEQISDFLLKLFQTRGSSLLSAALIAVLGMLLTRLLLRLLKRAVERSRLDPTYHRFLLSLSKYSLYILVWILALSQLEVDMTSLVTVLGVGGVAASLAIKDSLANLAGGFIILFTRPFKVGDFIEVDGLSGTVAQINTFQTKLITFDNKGVFIPNGQVSASRIVNYTTEEKRLLAISVRISYTADLSHCQDLLLTLMRENPRVLHEPEPAVRITEYGESAILLSLRAWVPTEQYWDLNWELMEGIRKVFQENSILIPFNRLDVCLVNDQRPC